MASSRFTVSGTPGDPSLTFFGGMGRWVGELRRNSGLIHTLFWRRYVHRFEGSVLGIVWVVVMPCVPLVVYTTLQYMGIFNASSENLPRAVFTGWGILFFFVFADTLRLTSGMLILHRREILQTGIPKMVLLVVAAFQALVDLLMRSAALGVTMALMGIRPDWWIFLAPVFAMALAALGFSIGCVLSLVAVYYRDLLNLIVAFLSYLFYASAVFITFNPKQHVGFIFGLLRWQPTYMIIDGGRQLCLLDKIDHPVALAVTVLICFACVPFGVTLFYRGESLVNSHL
jgi:ABC-2 type transport system permease protein